MLPVEVTRAASREYLSVRVQMILDMCVPFALRGIRMDSKLPKGMSLAAFSFFSHLVAVSTRPLSFTRSIQFQHLKSFTARNIKGLHSRAVSLSIMSF